ncbi:uncharacterized protein LOC111341757 [Stylophora pistillata]|uniref:uncharacterized protein LOC111341757 n=1 Tax=Stylophora pistillata TaxID=50429 RepID=UPI000C0403E0|nr:uncharacterized protein LOC111341757 [Stylophora pistillata]
MCRLIWICVLFLPFIARANCGVAKDQHIIVDNDVKNISVGVHPFGSVSISWSIGKQVYERIVLAIANASNPLAKLRNGKLNCYKQSTFTEEECKSHFSLFRNASVDVIFRMRNVSDLYFGTYLLSMYGGIDPEIKTLWIKVYNKAGLTPTPMSTPTSMPMSMPTSMQTHKNDATAGTSHLAVIIVVPILTVIVVGILALIAVWRWKKRSKRIARIEAGGDESKEEKNLEMSELDSQDNLVTSQVVTKMV